MMRQQIVAGVLAAFGLAILATATARAGEEAIAPGKLPKAVRKAVKKAFEGATIRGAAREVEGGKTTFEVMLKAEGRSIDVAVAPDGKILEVEKEVELDDVPRAVRKAIEVRYPGGKILKVEAVRAGLRGPVVYEAAVATEVVVNSKGKFVDAKGEDEGEKEHSAKPRSSSKEEDEDDDDDKVVKRGKASQKDEADEDDDDDDQKVTKKGKKAEKEDEDDDDDDDDKVVKSKKRAEKHEADDDDDEEDDDD